jgi:Glycosyltransferase family 87
MVEEYDPGAGATAAPNVRAPAARRRVFVLAALSILLVLWLAVVYEHGKLRQGPNGRAFGSDFAIYWTAAHMLKDGGNPYDHVLLYNTERSLLHRQSLPIMPTQSIPTALNPPLFFWALRPLTGLPFQPTAWAWILSMYALAAIGFLAALRYLGWTVYLLPCLLFLAMPQVVFAAFYGNVQGLMLAAVGCSLLLIKRYPLVAGILSSLAWLKPQVGLPIVLLLVLFHSPSRQRFLIGFSAAFACLFALALVATGWHSLTLWVSQLVQFHGNMAAQPNIVSLTSLYVLWAPSPVRLALEILSFGMACALTGLWWRRCRNTGPTPILSSGWLWGVWFLAVPYAHFPDEILLAVPILALLGRNGHRVAYGLSATVLYIMLFSTVLFPRTLSPVEVLSLPLLAVTVCLALGTRARWYREEQDAEPDSRTPKSAWQALSP